MLCSIKVETIYQLQPSFKIMFGTAKLINFGKRTLHPISGRCSYFITPENTKIL